MPYKLNALHAIYRGQSIYRKLGSLCTYYVIDTLIAALLMLARDLASRNFPLFLDGSVRTIATSLP